MAVPYRLVADLRNVWICAQDLQLIRADRVVSVLVPVGSCYGAASPGDLNLHGAIYAEIDGGTAGSVNLIWPHCSLLIWPHPGGWREEGSPLMWPHPWP